MNIEERVKNLIERAQTTGAELNLTQIARVCDVDYDKIWRFVTRNTPLKAIDAEKIEKALENV
jgi:hypothetical protein